LCLAQFKEWQALRNGIDFCARLLRTKVRVNVLGLGNFEFASTKRTEQEDAVSKVFIC
jgi:hypothetical protein